MRQLFIHRQTTVRKLILLVFIACSMSFILFTEKAEASVSYAIPLQEVVEAENYHYPNMTTLDNGYEWKIDSSFIIDTPGQVKAILYCPINSNLSGNVWLCKDSAGRNIVGKISQFTDKPTEVSWFLERGSYYLFTSITKPPLKQLEGGPYLNTAPQLNIALLYEKLKYIEPDPTDSFDNSFYIQYKETIRGFLTNEKPADYYSFNLSEKASVTVKYSFDTSTASSEEIGYCSLYDTNDLSIKKGTYMKADEGVKKYTYLLEPGIYHIKLNGLLGKTTLSIEPMYYDIKLTPVTDESWTKKQVKVKIDTSIEYSDMKVLFMDAKASFLNNNNIWSETNKALIPLEGETFIAKKSGTYTVRITDQNGNNTMKKLKISNIDVKKPEIKGVTNLKAYKKSVTPTWKDTQSGIDQSKTTLNGKVIKSGTLISKEGKYILKVYDNIGNCNTVTFYIDHTMPVTNVENGKTYTNSLILIFKDSISGIKKIEIDGEEVPAANNTKYFYLEGQYTVELWDKAGNHRKYKFSIKKE